MDRRSRAASGNRVAVPSKNLTVGLTVGMFFLTLAGATPAEAQASTPAVLAAPCSACHGTGGKSPGEIPSIDRLDAAVLAARLRGFRSGEIQATVMNRIAKGYTDVEIEALAQYFVSLRR